MLERKDIQNLTNLARIKVTPEEEEALLSDVLGILDYISLIQSVEVSDTSETHTLINILREDGDPHEGGLYTEKILNEAPKTDRGFIAVKKIF